MSGGSSFLRGRPAISAFVGESWKTIRSWIAEGGFPARKMNGVWESDAALIREWRLRRLMNMEAIDHAKFMGR